MVNEATPETDTRHVCVVIVGGGPVGMTLASELRLAGVCPVVLERLPEPSRLAKANGLAGRIVQAFDHRGLLERLSAQASSAGPARFYQFGGINLDLSGLPDNPLHALHLRQPKLEKLLEEHARELGAEIRRGHEVKSFSQDDEGVTVEVTSATGTYAIRAAYLVGCDGAHSTIRKQAGIGFPGTIDNSAVTRLADVVLPEGAARRIPELKESGFGMVRRPGGMFGLFPHEGGVYRIATMEWNQPPLPEGDMTFDDLKASVARVLGADLPMHEASWLSRTSGNSRQAERYRANRVFLAGDAAHVHSALGGPGLNLGLSDAMNLGWKLAGVIQGWTSSEILDSYDRERRPPGERVMMFTQAQKVLLAPGDSVTALRSLFSELIHRSDNLRWMAELLAGADIRYVLEDAAGCSHPLVGRWAPDFKFVIDGKGKRLAELMRGGRAVVLDLTADGVFASAAASWSDRINVIVARFADGPASFEGLLVRPDGYIAWIAAETEKPAASVSLQDALVQWFGR